MVKDVLRQALQEEKAALMEDVEYFTSLLEAETDMQVGGVASACDPRNQQQLRGWSPRVGLHSALEVGFPCC